MYLTRIQTAVPGKNLQAAGRSAQVLLAALAFLGVGFATLRNHDSGDLIAPPPPSPEAAFIDAKHLSLVVALHPGCSCASATIGELSRIYFRAPEEVQITILAFKPGLETVAWAQASDRAAVAKLKARILMDTNGAIARRLGMATSGQLHVYSPNGKLLYNGGITAPSGRKGENMGEQTVMDIINGNLFYPEPYPVYGRSLFDNSLNSEHIDGLKTAARF